MSTETIIAVENLGKKYSLSHLGDQRYIALRDVLVEKATGLFRRGNTQLSTLNSQLTKEEFWALKDVSFEVKHGEVMGIIGRNGAGKSTLLKILSRITEPTEGRVRIRGRVASLLEVGTGFHPELTGRENIFLNGAILGMTKAEIKRKFDEIVDFAEVEKFLDTPVKRYSSGMYVRLAFAVAAHLEPEILVVDEVLAVGDAEFQKKCLGKMHDVSTKEGRTVLFVSHNMGAVRALCSKAILLSAGKLESEGKPATLIDLYLSSVPRNRTVISEVRGGGLELVHLSIGRESPNDSVDALCFNDTCSIRCIVSGSTSEKVAPVLQIFTATGELISSVCGPEEGIDFLPINGRCDFRIVLGQLQLMPGNYHMIVAFYGAGPEPLLKLNEPIEFSVEASPLPNAMRAYRGEHGIVRLAKTVEVRVE